MQVLSTECPYCQHEVDTTIEHLDGPVICPNCEKPFEMEMPTAIVTSVAEVAEDVADDNRIAEGPEERTLAEVHPVVFRAHPLATLTLLIVSCTAVTAIILSLLGTTVAGIGLGETAMIGPASLLTWVCAIALLIVACVIGYWMVVSRFTTLKITDDRTIYRQGFVSRETSEVQHDDVRNIQLDQSFAQRLLMVGGIGISSSGQDELEVVAHGLPHPERIIELIRENQT